MEFGYDMIDTNEDDFIIKGCSISDDYIIAWSDHLCRVFDIEIGKYFSLTLSLNHEGIHVI
jgi:hypothetical protein